MNGKRCAIHLGMRCVYEGRFLNLGYNYRVTITGHATGSGGIRRIFGSHSEAKRELVKWLPSWPDATIVEEMDL